MLMMHKSVSLKYALVSCSVPTEEVPSVHQLAVDLVLDKRHQNARDKKPAKDLQNKHHLSSEDEPPITPAEARHSRTPAVPRAVGTASPKSHALRQASRLRAE